MALKKYSVLLLYPDYMGEDWPHETFLAYVAAKNPPDAIKNAQKQAAKINKQSKTAYDFYPLLCIQGHHKDFSYEHFIRT